MSLRFDFGVVCSCEDDVAKLYGYWFFACAVAYATIRLKFIKHALGRRADYNSYLRKSEVACLPELCQPALFQTEVVLVIDVFINTCHKFTVL